MKKVINFIAFASISWMVLLFVYNYRSQGQAYGILIPTFMTGVAMTTAYLFNYWLIPRYYFVKDYFRFTFFTLATLILSTYIQLLFVFGLFIHIKFDLQRVTPRLLDVLVIISSTWLLILASISIKQTNEAAAKAKKQEKLLKEKLEMELQLLKAQINPHFLFNTLNSIYVLARKKSAITAEMVLKLSGILDFLLHNSSANEIEIAKEVSFIEDYIALEQLRYGKKLELNLSVDLSDPHRKIEPMLLIPLVENAFKHGVKSERKKAIVSIKINDVDGIELEVTNSVPLLIKDKEKSGMGLTNLKNRLNNRYPNRHELTYNRQENSFVATLKIN